jgi:hypothetical protein
MLQLFLIAFVTMYMRYAAASDAHRAMAHVSGSKVHTDYII